MQLRICLMKTHEKLTWILFAFVLIALYLFALDLPLLGPDEPRYSQVAREMYERGDWITTTLGGFNWFEKPALLYWLQITFYNLFGVSEFSARLGSALFGLGTTGSLFVLGKVYIAEAGKRDTEVLNTDSKLELRRQNPELPYWLALVAASSIGLIAFSRGASFDIIITFPITAALVSFFIWKLKTSRDKSNFFHPCLISFYFFIGIALIGKGLIGIIFPFAIVIFYYLLSRAFPEKSLVVSFVWGTILSLIVSSVWYLPMYLTNGWAFLNEFFIQHHFQRFSSNKFQHPQPFWFFFVVLPLMTIPWIPFFFTSLWMTLKGIFVRERVGIRGKRDQPALQSQLSTFAFAWMLVPLIFFSLSGSKLPGYILPSLPAACILIGLSVSAFVRKNGRRKFSLQMLAFLTFAVVAFLLQFALPNFAKDDSVKSLVDSANSKGYSIERILNYQTVSHSLEFYGAKRLVRTTDGKQIRFDKTEDLKEFIGSKHWNKVLVLLPTQFEKDFSENDDLVFEPISENRELAIIAVTRK